MSDGFTKLFSSIIFSSVWSEDDRTRIVWITMLALADADGFVCAALPGIANSARVPLEETAKAIKRLEAPDPHSRSSDHDGRRIEKIDGGWLVLNYRMYRDRARTEKRKSYLRDYQRDYMRDVRHPQSNAGSTEVQQGSTDVQPSASASASASSSAFEECWIAFGRYGVKKKAWGYWQCLCEGDRGAVRASIGPYLYCVEAGRAKKQFEGWINPENRLWEMDWESVLKELSRPVKARPIERPSLVSGLRSGVG